MGKNIAEKLEANFTIEDSVKANKTLIVIL